MRCLIPVVLIWITGCVSHCPHRLHKSLAHCQPECATAHATACEQPQANPRPCAPTLGGPEAAPVCAPAPVAAPPSIRVEHSKPEVEVRQAPVHIKLPPQKIVVPREANDYFQSAQGMAAAQAASPFAAQATPQATVMTPVAVSQSLFGDTVAGRARPGLTFDFIRIPIPFPRFIAVPTQPEFRMTAVQQSVPAQAVMMQQAAFSQAAPMMASAAYPAQNHAVVPVTGQAVVPVQGQAIVPVQGQAVVPVQAAAQMQAMPFQPSVGMSANIAAQPSAAAQCIMIPQQGAAAVQAQANQINPEQMDELCRRWQQYKDTMKKAP